MFADLSAGITNSVYKVLLEKFMLRQFRDPASSQNLSVGSSFEAGELVCISSCSISLTINFNIILLSTPNYLT